MNLTKRALLLACALLPMMAAAQDNYPNRPIKFIVPFPAGGGTDMLARAVSARLADSWKVPVLVENRPGGNTIIAAESVARAAPDGYTVFMPIDSTLAMNQSLYAKLPYDPINSFTPVTLAASMPMVLAVHPGVNVRDVKGLLELAKANNGKLAYAFGALPAQVAGEVFKAATSADMLAIPYKGGAPAMSDVIGGQVPVIFDALGPAMAHIKAGRVRPLAVTSRARTQLLPDLPTLAEAGVNAVPLDTWIGFVLPAGADKAIVNKLNAELVRILNLKETRDQLANVGMTVVANTPEQFAQVIKDDAAKFALIIKAAGIKLD
jgi:tripartite-type tricarboxylate transporter receptor subunit TctC